MEMRAGGAQPIVIDLGCGNGRNTIYLVDNGFEDVNAFDMKPDFGEELHLGKEKIPVGTGAADIVMVNYVFMFLTERELAHACREICRIVKPGGLLLWELYAAKESYTPDARSVGDMYWALLEYFVDRGFTSFVRLKNKALMKRTSKGVRK